MDSWSEYQITDIDSVLAQYTQNGTYIRCISCLHWSELVMIASNSKLYKQYATMAATLLLADLNRDFCNIEFGLDDLHDTIDPIIASKQYDILSKTDTDLPPNFDTDQSGLPTSLQSSAESPYPPYIANAKYLTEQDKEYLMGVPMQQRNMRMVTLQKLNLNKKRGQDMRQGLQTTLNKPIKDKCPWQVIPETYEPPNSLFCVHNICFCTCTRFTCCSW